MAAPGFLPACAPGLQSQLWNSWLSHASVPCKRDAGRGLVSPDPGPLPPVRAWAAGQGRCCPGGRCPGAPAGASAGPSPRPPLAPWPARCPARQPAAPPSSRLQIWPACGHACGAGQPSSPAGYTSPLCVWPTELSAFCGRAWSASRILLPACRWHRVRATLRQTGCTWFSLPSIMVLGLGSGSHACAAWPGPAVARSGKRAPLAPPPSNVVSEREGRLRQAAQAGKSCPQARPGPDGT